MKKAFMYMIWMLLFSNLILASEDVKYFMGYTYNGDKERYMYVNSVDDAIMNIEYGKKEKKKLLQFAAFQCMGDNHWYKARLISSKSKGDFHSYKFKFYYILNSIVFNVDVSGGTMRCKP